MFYEKDFVKSTYKTGEVAKVLGVTPRTVQNWDKSGKLVVHLSATGRRMIYREDLLNLVDSLGLLIRADNSRVDIIYARVSSHEQRAKGDLDRQALFLMEHCKDLIKPIILKEVGSGLNDKRPQLLRLITMVENDEISRIFVTYRDRLTRFGFNYIRTICLLHNTEIVVANDIEGKKNVQDELVEDMMALIASFSGKLYGLRAHKNRKS